MDTRPPADALDALGYVSPAAAAVVAAVADTVPQAAAWLSSGLAGVVHRCVVTSLLLHYCPRTVVVVGAPGEGAESAAVVVHVVRGGSAAGS